jgi:NAD(P)H-dependent FMN reductase
MIHPSKVLVIVGSTRARRLCQQIAQWVAEVGRETIREQIEVVDLKDWPLPADDEPDVPALGGYAFEHTRAWSRAVANADAFVFVTPQYNWGYPAPLKNALDHLYKEWSGKPAMIVAYGGHGGGKCARQLRQVLKGLHMRPVASAGLKLPHKRIKANTGAVEPASEFARHRGAVRRGFRKLSAALGGRRFGTWPRLWTSAES